jgi:nucleoside-diphosphate-sugar epimerase
MKINILGGYGLVGHGIYLALSEFYDVKIYNSTVFNKKKFEFNDLALFDCDIFIHAAGVTDEEVASNYNFSILKSTKFINLICSELEKQKCTKIVYISTIHVFGNLKKKITSNSIPNPLTSYSLFHYCTEKIFEFNTKISSKKLKLLILRVPTIYGFPKHLDQINRPSIIQFAFPLSLIHSNQIILNTNGLQYRLFASNIKVGNFVKIWINRDFKSRISKYTLNGINLTVLEFCNLCLLTYRKINKTSNPKIKVGSPSSTNDTFKPIYLETLDEISEPFKLVEYLDYFFKTYK